MTNSSLRIVLVLASIAFGINTALFAFAVAFDTPIRFGIEAFWHSRDIVPLMVSATSVIAGLIAAWVLRDNN